LNKGQSNLNVIVDGFDPADHSLMPGFLSLIRAGETLSGNDSSPIRGWISPTYLEKIPALSFSVTFNTTKSLEIKTRLIL
jgi:hypothetical protein